MKLPPALSAFKDEETLDDPNQSLSDNLFKLQELGKKDSIMATDCKSLFDLVSRTAPPACQKFRTLLQARLIKEHLSTGVAIRWAPSYAQIADSLTKVMDIANLRQLLNAGRYQLQDEGEILRHRSDKKARLDWIQTMPLLRQLSEGKAKTSSLNA